MANKNKAQKSGNKKVDEEVHEPVANCDHLEKGEISLNQHDIEKLIITVRGEQVLIDRDLANIYQVEVKQMNRQVKRNIDRFPEDFMFQLTKTEYDSLKCHLALQTKGAVIDELYLTPLRNKVSVCLVDCFVAR